MGLAPNFRFQPTRPGPKLSVVRENAPAKAAKAVDLSVIIPTLNAGARLTETIEALAEARETLAVEIIVVDGGSQDDTPARAAAADAMVVSAPRGRGMQLSAGAKEASGRWLLFLHANTTLEPFWSTTVTSFIRRKGSPLKAAYFTFALDDASEAARRVEILANWRARALGLPYGDQGLLMSRTMYDSLVGYLDIPVMEDVEIARRIGKRNLLELPATATTSSERYKRDGFSWRATKGLSQVALYFLGVPPRQLTHLLG